MTTAPEKPAGTNPTTDEVTRPRIVLSPDAPWLAIAQKYLGTREGTGESDNALVVKWLEAVGPFHHDETPWCSAFANAVMREAGIKGTGKANARSWLKWGQPLAAPKLGCVVVFSRPPLPASGHVAFYVGDGPNHSLRVLGGNQGNRVCVATYPRERLLGYRWPA